MKVTDLGVALESLDLAVADRYPVFQKGDPTRFRGVLPIESLRYALATQEWEYPRLRFSKDGQPIPPEHYLHGIHMVNGSVRNRLSPQACEELLSDGAMLTVDGVHVFDGPLNEFVCSLQDAFHGPAHANLYLARKGRGFPPHFDFDDTFVLQLAGAKVWQLAPPTIIDPDASLHSGEKSRLPPPLDWVMEYRLEVGDFLHVPRGWWHVCQTVDGQGSYHITTGVTPLNWVDYIDSVVRDVGKTFELIRRAAVLSDPGLDQLHAVVAEIVRRAASREAITRFFATKTTDRWATPIAPDAFQLLSDQPPP